MDVRQLFDPGSSTYSYLLWNPACQAVLIDPVRDQLTRDLRLVRKLRLNLRYTLETHVHTDHVTGSGLLRRALNSLSLCMKTAAPCALISC